MARSRKTVLEILKNPANREINILIVEDEHHLVESVARRMEEDGIP